MLRSSERPATPTLYLATACAALKLKTMVDGTPMSSAHLVEVDESYALEGPFDCAKLLVVLTPGLLADVMLVDEIWSSASPPGSS